MRRNPATLLWVRSIPIAVVLAIVAACSTPKPEVAKSAPPEKAPAAEATPEPSTPPAPVIASNAPVTNDAPTPAETPLPPPPTPEVSAGEPKTSPPEPAPDPVKWMQDQEAKRGEYQRSLEQLRADREAAEAHLARCERDLLAFRNPYLARPNLKPAEAGEVQGLNGVERVKWAEARVANAIASLESAKQAYDDAKANPPVD